MLEMDNCANQHPVFETLSWESMMRLDDIYIYQKKVIAISMYVASV